MDHLVDAPVLGRADLAAVALRHRRDRLLLAGGEGRVAVDEPDDVVEMEIPDGRGDELAARLDLDHARLEAGDEALGVGAGVEDVGAAGAADLLGVRAGLGEAEVVDVLARMDRDRVGPAAVGRQVRIGGGVEDRLPGAGRGGDDREYGRARDSSESSPDEPGHGRHSCASGRGTRRSSARVPCDRLESGPGAAGALGGEVRSEMLPRILHPSEEERWPTNAAPQRHR